LVDFSGADFLYFKLENYSPAEIGNIVNITLIHRTSNLILDLKQILYKEYVKDVSITPNYMSGAAKIATGEIVERKDPTEYNIEELTFNSSEGEILSSLVPINNSDSIRFKAKIKHNNKFNEIELPFKLDLGIKYTLTLKLTYNCGAYVSKDEWKEFMCHNLGGRSSDHPMNGEEYHYDRKYLWGHRNDINSNEREDITIKSWQDDFKTDNDPCPVGYRIPKPEIFNAITQYNNVEVIKSWTGDYPLMKFGEDLILPFAGSSYARSESGVNEVGNYWTSHANGKNGDTSFSYNYFFISKDGRYSMKEGQTYNSIGRSIRCVEEKETIVWTGWEDEKDLEIDADKIIKEKEAKKKKKGKK